MELKKIILMGLVCLISNVFLSAQEKENIWKGSRPDGHAPISVMGDHYHSKGNWMFSYRYMFMNMENVQSGTNEITPNQLLMPNGGTYMVAPTKMPMNMHMIGIMYAPSDRITLMAMVNHLSQEMDHITAMGGSFTTESSGFGDLGINLIYKLSNKNRNSFHGQLGFSLPTGSIQNRGVTPTSNGNEVILPYPMQIGSGTLDTNLGLTYLGQSDNFSWGNQLKGIVQFGENKNGYRLGNTISLNNWFAIKASKWISFSARVEGRLVGKIKGENPDLNPTMIFTADASNSGGEFVFGGLGCNFYVPNGGLKNLRLGFEFTTPLYQNANGFQMRNQETITIGIQYAL